MPIKKYFLTLSLGRHHNFSLVFLTAALVFFAIPWSCYEWFWLRAPDGRNIAWLVASAIIGGLMVLRLQYFNPKRRSRKLLLLAAILVFATQLFGAIANSTTVVEHRQNLPDGGEVMALGMGTFGGTWTNIVTRTCYGVVLCREVNVKQYSNPSVTGLKVNDDGNLTVSLSEYGRSDYLEVLDLKALQAKYR
ncbi:hypothetical protein [Roseateles sp.]|uniref:hypothetical protein n=1 Tax=Roseateles sp. TaxID=1971397 RepID=UPI00286AF368|nr:hypothetical protein [Roseateles sp.]